MLGRSVIIAIYVDDLLIFGISTKAIEEVKNAIKERFDIKDLGVTRRCLGINIRRTPSSIKLNQSDYAQNIAKQFRFGESKPVSTPIDNSTYASLFENGKPMPNREWYAQAVGSLMHLCHTRPDIVCATNIVSQFTASPCQNH